MKKLAIIGCGGIGSYHLGHFKQFTDILKNSGLEEIEAVGHDFDPNFHHAVLTDSNPDFDSGKVTEVLQKGYKLNGKVIRPSMVKVNE